LRARAPLIDENVGARYVTLDTDDFGRHDPRQQWRGCFEVDAVSIVSARCRRM